MSEVIELKPCPWCGCKAVRGMTKKRGCQMHGEPIQEATVYCNSQSCPARPMICGRLNIHESGKDAANKEASEIWNGRFTPVGTRSEVIERAIQIAKVDLQAPIPCNELGETFPNYVATSRSVLETLISAGNTLVISKAKGEA